MKFLILYILYVHLKKKNNNTLTFKIKKNIAFSLNITQTLEHLFIP